MAIADWLDERADEMAALVEALVRVPTENPPGRELARCADVLSEALDRLGFAPERIEQDAIVRGTVGDGDALVYYHGHFDVVPAQSRSQFEPVRRDGRIVGRGTADMKGGLVSMLYGAAAARELGLLEGRRIVLHFVCDEETGSTAGSGHLRAAGLIDPSARRDAHRRADRRRDLAHARAARSRCASRPPGARRTSATCTRASTRSST